MLQHQCKMGVTGLIALVVGLSTVEGFTPTLSRSGLSILRPNDGAIAAANQGISLCSASGHQTRLLAASSQAFDDEGHEDLMEKVTAKVDKLEALEASGPGGSLEPVAQKAATLLAIPASILIMAPLGILYAMTQVFVEVFAFYMSAPIAFLSLLSTDTALSLPSFKNPALPAKVVSSATSRYLSIVPSMLDWIAEWSKKNRGKNIFRDRGLNVAQVYWGVYLSMVPMLLKWVERNPVSLPSGQGFAVPPAVSRVPDAYFSIVPKILGRVEEFQQRVGKGPNLPLIAAEKYLSIVPSLLQWAEENKAEQSPIAVPNVNIPQVPDKYMPWVVPSVLERIGGSKPEDSPPPTLAEKPAPGSPPREEGAGFFFGKKPSKSMTTTLRKGGSRAAEEVPEVAADVPTTMAAAETRAEAEVEAGSQGEEEGGLSSVFKPLEKAGRQAALGAIEAAEKGAQKYGPAILGLAAVAATTDATEFAVAAVTAMAVTNAVADLAVSDKRREAKEAGNLNILSQEARDEAIRLNPAVFVTASKEEKARRMKIQMEQVISVLPSSNPAWSSAGKASKEEKARRMSVQLQQSAASATVQAASQSVSPAPKPGPGKVKAKASSDKSSNAKKPKAKRSKAAPKASAKKSNKKPKA